MRDIFKYICITCVLLLTAACDTAVPEIFQPTEESHYFSVNKSSLTFYADGSSSSFDINTTESWAVTGFDYWLSASSENGTGSSKVTMTAEANPSADLVRTSIFNVATADPEWDFTKTISADQLAATPYIDLSEDVLYIPGTSGTHRIYVKSNTSWSVYVNGGDWCSVQESNDKSYIDINVNENNLGYTRSVYVILTGGTSKVIEINQWAATISSNQQAIEFPRDGGSLLIEVNAEASWESYSSADWVEISPSSGAAGKSEVIISATPNWSERNRTGYIDFSIGNKVISVEVTQKRAYISTITEWTLDALGDAYSYFEVSSNFSWEVLSAPSWLEAKGVTTGDLAGTLMIHPENNRDTVSRSGIITIGKEGYSVKAEILVTQPGKYFAVNNEALAIGSRGGTMQVRINTNDIWGITPKNNADWLTFSTTSGRSSKTVEFYAGDNPSVNTRSETVNIAPVDVESVDVVVRQEARYLEVDTYGVLLYGKAGKSAPITVSTDGKYTITTDVDWLSFSQVGDIFFIHSLDNRTKQPRHAEVKISLTDLIDGELSLSISVEQLVRGGNIKLDDYDEDTDWNLNYYGILSLSAIGFDKEEDWTSPSYRGLTVSKTGYSKDQNWEGSFGSFHFDKDNYLEDNNMDSAPGNGNIGNDDFNDDSSYDTPSENVSGDIGKDDYEDDGGYDNSWGNVGADKDEHPDDDTYDDSVGNGNIDKNGYSEDNSYDPNNSSEMDKDGYADDDSYDNHEGTGDIDKEGHQDEDTSYDDSEGEGDINKEDFSDEVNYDNDNL